MHAHTLRATTAHVTTGRGTLPETNEAWREIRDDSSIQFEPPAPEPPPEPSEWERQLGEFLEWLFAPIAQFISDELSLLQWIVIIVVGCIAALLVWRLIEPYFVKLRDDTDDETSWQPEREQAIALLEDADRLAESGDYAGAVHLLLNRSVGQIAAAQPNLVEPSSTARELAGQETLPDKARSAFGVIATAVERSLFALQDLGRDDWQQARTAYADFALERLN